MKVNISSRYFYALLSFCFAISVEGVQHESNTSQSVVKKRSIKDAFPKDDEFSSRSIIEVRHKVNTLEGSISKIDDEILQLSKQNEEFEKDMLQQKTLLETVVEEVGELQKQFSSHDDRLSDLDKMTSSTENMFAFSNQTCGGELVGQSGVIVFSRNSRSGYFTYPSNCVWTVRSKNRAFVKVSMKSSNSFRRSFNAFVLETIKTKVTGSSNSSKSLETKITRLQIQKGVQYVFTGPTIFIVASLDSRDFELHIEFDGFGKLVEKDTFFTHETLHANSGSFSNTELKTWNFNPLLFTKLNDKSNYTLDYTTLVVSNFSGMALFQAKLGNRECSNEDSFIIISDMRENSTKVTDCCKTSCEGNSSLISYHSPFVVLISKRFQQSFNFTLTWDGGPVYPSSTSNVYQCGGILAGQSGTITYRHGYSFNQRCIWVIVPQPGPTSFVSLDVFSNKLRQVIDDLYMMELTDADGKELSEGPKITRLTAMNRAGFRSYANQVQSGETREVYIVFYSNSNINNDFSLDWKALPGTLKTEHDVTTRFAIVKTEAGSFSMLSNPGFTNSGYHVFISTPVIRSANTTEYNLQLSQTLPAVGENFFCENESWSVFTGVDGVVVKSELECENPGEAVIHNADGLAIIIRKFQNPNSKMAMDFKWIQENITEVLVNDNNCGGVISAEKGMLTYRHGVQHLNNERCIWLLRSPRKKSITVDLHGGYHQRCCDFILINTINLETGTLRNDTTVIINHDNSKRTFEEPLLVIVFYSTNTYNAFGFSLKFSTHGKILHAKSQYSYKLHHSSEPDGNVQFPSSGLVEGNADLYIFATSPALQEETFKLFTAIDWNTGVFNSVNNSCSYDSLNIYEPLFDNEDNWVMRQQFPNRNETETFSCPETINVPAVKNAFQLKASSFLGIYKRLSSQTDPNVTRAHFSFDYYQKSYGCGGTLEGEFGVISYKEDLKYANNENCTWTIKVPEYKSIEFNLEKSGLEGCCDVVTITSTNVNGIALPESTKLITANQTYIISGSRAFVSFTSDTAVTGYGFRLRYEKSLYLFINDDLCGGLITGDTGILNYKTEVDYFNNERCVWLLHSPNKTSITLELIQDGFETCCDYLLVSTINPSIGTLRSNTTQISRANKIQTFEESLLIVEFRSDARTRGKGFSLRFTATGNNSNLTYSYNPHHISEAHGTVDYPSSNWGGVSTNRRIFVLAHSLNIRTDDDAPTIPTSINWISGMFKKSNESCEYDTFTFYSQLGERGWLTRTRLPDDVNDTLSCEDVITLPAKSNIWSVPNSAFVVVFKPTLSNQNMKDSLKFLFAYSKGVSCGGTYIGNSGIITYKEDQIYENFEECVWLIEAPQAKTISFTLEKNGFEDCCDFITLSSVDALSSIVKADAVLKSNIQRTTINGPVVIVTFSSDESVTGSGFRLRFSTVARAARPYSKTYRISHQSIPYNVFAYHVEANQVVIFVYNPPSSTRQNARVNITAFRPQVDDMCNSDSILIYNMYRRGVGREFRLSKNFTASDVIEDESFDGTNCSALGNSQFSQCDNIYECNDAPDGGAVSMNTISFLVVYRSVNVTGSLRFRGFALISDSDGSTGNQQLPSSPAPVTRSNHHFRGGMHYFDYTTLHTSTHIYHYNDFY